MAVAVRPKQKSYENELDIHTPVEMCDLATIVTQPAPDVSNLEFCKQIGLYPIIPTAPVFAALKNDHMGTLLEPQLDSNTILQPILSIEESLCDEFIEENLLQFDQVVQLERRQEILLLSILDLYSSIRGWLQALISLTLRIFLNLDNPFFNLLNAYLLAEQGVDSILEGSIILISPNFLSPY